MRGRRSAGLRGSADESSGTAAALTPGQPAIVCNIVFILGTGRTHVPDGGEGTKAWRHASGSGALAGIPRKPSADPDAEDRHRRRYGIVEQAAPLPHETVPKKTAPSAVFGTPLLAHLMATGIDTLIVCGEAVSGCLRAIVVDGCSYRLRLVEECVHDPHVFDIDQKYGDVMSLEETLDWIAKHAPADAVAEPDHADSHDDGHPHEAEASAATKIPARVLAQPVWMG